MPQLSPGFGNFSVSLASLGRHRWLPLISIISKVPPGSVNVHLEDKAIYMQSTWDCFPMALPMSKFMLTSRENHHQLPSIIMKRFISVANDVTAALESTLRNCQASMHTECLAEDGGHRKTWTNCSCGHHCPDVRDRDKHLCICICICMLIPGLIHRTPTGVSWGCAQRR